MNCYFRLPQAADFTLADQCLRDRIRYFFPESTIVEAGEVTPASAVVVSLSSHSPFIDEVLIRSMVIAAEKTGNTFYPVDNIPGTGPIEVSGAASGISVAYHSTMQPTYCTNFNVGRPNRRKIFTALLEREPRLATLPMLEILDFLESDAGVDFVLGYGEGITLQDYSACPICGGRGVPPLRLYSGTSHPITGFLTKRTSIYSQCLACSLVFLRKQMPEAELWRYYSKQSYAQSDSLDEIELLFGDLNETTVSHLANYEAINHLLDEIPTGNLFDLGAGRGEFAVWAKKAHPNTKVTAVDWRFDDVVSDALGRRGVDHISGDLLQSVRSLEECDLITAWEVIEHIKLETLPSMLSGIAKALAPGGRFVFSTPDFEDHFAKALDFWAMAPGEHISVFSRRSLEPILAAAGLQIVAEMHEAVTIKLANSWFSFGAATNAHFSSKAESFIIDRFLAIDECRVEFRKAMRSQNKGSELILICERA